MMTDHSEDKKRAPNLIENITDEKTICGIRYVLVSWKDQPSFTASWEPLDNLRRETRYHVCLNSKGLLFDEHLAKDPKKGAYSTPTGKNQFKLKKQESPTKASRSKRKGVMTKKKAPISPAELLFDEESTSINDYRGANENSRDGLASPTKKQTENKFTPYVTSKTRLTTHFYKDLVDYYRKCSGDNPPSPVIVEKRILRAEVEALVQELEPVKGAGKGSSAFIQESTKIKEITVLSPKTHSGIEKENKETLQDSIETQPSLESQRVKLSCKSRAESIVQPEGNLLMSKLQRMAKSRPGGSPRSKTGNMFSELLALAKAKLESKRDLEDEGLPDIFGKFEDRKGIANENEEEYKNNLLTKIPNTAKSRDNSKGFDQKIPAPTISRPPYNHQAVTPISGGIFIPNQPSMSLTDTIKKFFPSH